MRAVSTTLPRILALLAQFVTFCGFVVIVAGLATLQKTTNALGNQIPTEIVQAYDTTFSYGLVTPYSGNHGFQFSYIWFIIFFELFVLLLTLAVTFLPRFGLNGRPAALALLASAMTLVITVVNNLTYFQRSPVAQQVYGKKDLNVTLAGSYLVVLGNAFTILALGTWAVQSTTTHVAHTTNPHHYDTTANQAKRDVEIGSV